MESTLHHLHCRYRVLGDVAAAQRLTGRLEESVAPRLASAVGEMLEQALGDDPTVYVLRRAHSTLALPVQADSEDQELIAAWAERLAGSLVRTVADDPADGANLVRFADEADYVARFVADLAEGRAWEQWYYLAFKRLSAKPRGEALLAVLLEHRQELPAILALLAERGALARVLAALPPRGLTELWLAGLAGQRLAPAAGGRALFAAALELLRALGIAGPGREAAESLYRRFREEVAAGGGTDWSSPEELAQGVARALALLLAEGALERSELALAAPRFAAAAASFEWLDREELRQALEHLAAPPAMPRGVPRRGPTPRLRRLLEALAAVARELAGRLDSRLPDSPANALALAAGLYRRDPEWQGETAVVELLERLLAAWAALAALPEPRRWLRRLETGEPGALAALPAGPPRRAAERLAELGSEGVAVVAALLEGATPPVDGAVPDRQRSPEIGDGLESPAAGLFLLLRAILDLRLPALFEAGGFPAETAGSAGRGALGVLALALRWAGDAWPSAGGPLGRHLALLAGLDEPPERAALAQAFLSSPIAAGDRFQRRLLQTAAGQRLVRGSALRLFALPAGEAVALVAQAGDGDLWPLGRLLPATADASLGEAVIGDWLEAWEEIFDGPPEVASADAALGPYLPRPTGWPAWELVEPPPSSAGETAEPTGKEAANGSQEVVAPTSTQHRTSRDRLLAALASLEAGRLAPARPADADLTLALAATVVLRAWARWLKRFDDASVPFLLDSFLRREGRLVDGAEELRLELAPGSFDVVLEMAGYLAPLTTARGRRVTFSRRSSS